MKIGLGLITHKRKNLFLKVAASIPLKKIDQIVVVNDGTPYNVEPLKEHTIQNEKNLGVAKSKNIALKHLMDNGCEYIFLQEDDILINSPNVFEAYINLHKETGIHHFNYALHGKMNVVGNNVPNPRLTVNYKNNTTLSLYNHCVGAFSFYTKSILDKVGLIDERFENAFDHVEHTYRIIQEHKHPPFWWFADLHNSNKYLSDIEWSPATSTIHCKPNFKENFDTSLKYFEYKHQKAIFHIENLDKNSVVTDLKKIYDSK